VPIKWKIFIVINQVPHGSHHWLLHCSDIRTIRSGMAEKVSMVIQYFSMTITGVTIALVYAWKLALVTLAVAPLIGISSALLFVVSTILFSKKSVAFSVVLYVRTIFNFSFNNVDNIARTFTRTWFLSERFISVQSYP